MTRLFIQLSLFSLLILFISCQPNDDIDSTQSNGDEITVAGDQLLLDEVQLGEMSIFPDIAENQSESFERSFENAPPFIPHTVKGMTVITRNSNECILCHHPDKAKQEKATPMPESHFIDYRPMILEADGIYAVNASEGEVTAVTTGEQVNMAQYNCNLCHVALTNATVEIRNVFKANFRSSNSKSQSNLVDNMAEGIN